MASVNALESNPPAVGGTAFPSSSWQGATERKGKGRKETESNWKPGNTNSELYMVRWDLQQGTKLYHIGMPTSGSSRNIPSWPHAIKLIITIIIVIIIIIISSSWITIEYM
jgi:hypothetical protein